MLILLLACTGSKTTAIEPAPGPVVRVIRGPWEYAQALALAATGPRDLSGSWAGPTIILSAWVLDGELWAATSLDSGRGWTPPTKIDSQVVVGPDAQTLPRLAIALGRPVIAYVSEGVPKLAERSPEGWQSEALAERGGPLTLGVVDGEPVVSWVAEGGALFYDGLAVVEGACAESRPAISAEGQVAWRVPEGIMVDGELIELGGGCVADGPVFDGEVPVAAAEGVIHRGDEILPTLLEGWTAAQPRASGGALGWIEEKDGLERAVLQGTGLFTHEAILLGDPVVVAGEVWMPFIAGKPVVAAWSPARID